MFEKVIFSSKVSQPLLFYGRLLEHGWGINSREQMLENRDLKVPLNWQNRSLAVQGRTRVIRDEDANCLAVHVPEALGKESGWGFNEHGLLVGSLLLTSRFVDPTVIPEVEESPELMRATLVKRGGRANA